MGFLSDLGKAIMGQPLQVPDDNKHDAKPASEVAGEASVPSRPNEHLVDDRGYKIIPDIEAENLRSQRQGSDQLIVKAWIKNHSEQPIRIDYSYLLKQKRQQNQELSPHMSRELTLYQGKIPENEHEDNAQIAFRLKENGDVFMEQYRVEFYRESDGKFMVAELIDDGPVRDI